MALSTVKKQQKKLKKAAKRKAVLAKKKQVTHDLTPYPFPMLIRTVPYTVRLLGFSV